MCGHPVVLITYVVDIVVLGAPAGAKAAIELIQKHFKTNQPQHLEEATRDNPFDFLGQGMYLKSSGDLATMVVTQESYVKAAATALGQGLLPTTTLVEKHFSKEYLLEVDVEKNPLLAPQAHT